MSAYTSSLGLELITPGSQAGLWGNTCNNTFTLVDQAITGVTPLSFASASGSTYTLTDYNGAADEARSAVLNITGTAIGSNTVIVPNKQKTYLVRNNTGKDVSFQTASPSATYTVGAGYSILIFCDGNNNVFTGIAAPSVGTLLVNAGGTGNTTFTAGFIKSPGGTSALTSASSISLSSEVSGVLPVTNGGTGQSSLTGGALLFGNGTSGIGSFVGSASGQVATWNGSAWTAVTPTAAGVLSIAGSGINVSPATGNVTITLTGGNVTGALGYTPPSVTGSGASGTWGINISGNAATATSASTATSATSASTASVALSCSGNSATATTASNSTQLGGVAASGYMTVSTATTGSTAWSGLSYGTPGSTSGGFGIFRSGDACRIQIQTSNVGFEFHETGTANAVNGSWVNGSDRKLKKDINDLVSGIDVVSKIRPVSYKYISDSSSANDRHGVIAQELQEIIPDLVLSFDDYDGQADDRKPTGTKTLSVDYIGLIPHLICAIKELKAEIDALKASK